MALGGEGKEKLKSEGAQRVPEYERHCLAALFLKNFAGLFRWRGEAAFVEARIWGVQGHCARRALHVA